MINSTLIGNYPLSILQMSLSVVLIFLRETHQFSEVFSYILGLLEVSYLEISENVIATGYVIFLLVLKSLTFYE